MTPRSCLTYCVPRERTVGRDGRHYGCDVMYVSDGSSDDDSESVGGSSTVEYNGDNVSVEYLNDGYSDGISVEFQCCMMMM